MSLLTGEKRQHRTAGKRNGRLLAFDLVREQCGRDTDSGLNDLEATK
jgi:hypothetical protein